MVSVLSADLPSKSRSQSLFQCVEVNLVLSLHSLTVQTEVDPVDTNAEYLSNVSLSCTARGVPVPDFAWTMDSGSGPVDVMESGRFSITTTQISISQQMSTLTFTSVMPSDTAPYTCNASNSIGTDSRSAELTVQGEAFAVSVTTVSPLIHTCLVMNRYSVSTLSSNQSIYVPIFSHINHSHFHACNGYILAYLQPSLKYCPQIL